MDGGGIIVSHFEMEFILWNNGFIHTKNGEFFNFMFVSIVTFHFRMVISFYYYNGISP